MIYQLLILSLVVNVLTSSAVKEYINHENEFNNIQFNQLKYIYHHFLLNQNPANPSCFGCKSGLWMLKTFVFGSRKFIHDHIEVTCTNFKNIYKPCKRILTEFLDYAYDLIYGYSSADLCALAGICENPPKIDFCPLCLMSVEEGKNILLSDALLNELQSVFVHVCDYVRLEVQCSTFLNELYENAIDIIKHIVEPHFICQLGHMCNTTYTEVSNYN
uniref:Saposin B-type domain-containing protein n=1 Tax=Schistosoma mansoni TaxID=6183 RepID=A0A3Q0KMS2_SCHMA